MNPKDTWEQGSIPALSGAGDWSVVGPDGELPPDGDSAERYERRGLLGVGGMGKVFVARDHRLRREVALKVAKDPQMARRMTREAWITAQLEHPGIVPIYDAGSTEQGQLFYTMRLIRGRSLGESITDCADLDARLALLNHFLAAAQAVAYAHSLGIIHRDLKPANILVGEFGETQVADWGLARPLMDAEGAWELESNVTGTPRFMSPEQARGERVDARADVWALGVLLWELLCGAPPFEGESAEDILATLRQGASPLPSSLPTGIPEELYAIARKATAPRPDQRYPTARELAQDVARYSEGRRVQAHEYSTGELLGRVLRQWRAPLAVGLLALCGLAGMSGLLQQRITTERDLARDALAEADSNLSRALAGQAVAAAQAQARPEAEILAAHALSHGESPVARGVLAAYGRAERPRLLERRSLPRHCQGMQARVSPEGQWLLCSGAHRLELRSTETLELIWKLDEDMRMFWWRDGFLAIENAGQEYVEVDLESGQVLLRVPKSPTAFATSVDRGELVGLRAATLTWNTVDLSDPQLPGWTPQTIEGACTFSARATLVGDQVLLRCEDGTLQLYQDPKNYRTLGKIPDLLPFGAATVQGDLLLLGSLEGWVYTVNLRTDKVSDGLHSDNLAINQLVAVPGSSEHTVVVGEGGGPQIWNTRLDTWQNSLPGNPDIVGPSPNPNEVLLIGQELERWHIPATMGTPMIKESNGFADVEVDPQGVYIATASGNGGVTLREANTGRVSHHRMAPNATRTGVTKFVNFSPDGSTLVAATIWAGSYSMDRNLEILEELSSPKRRGGILADGRVWFAPYTKGLELLVDGVMRELDTAEIGEGVTTPNGRYAALLDVDDNVWLLDVQRAEPQRLFSVEQPRTLELSSDAQRFWIGVEEEVCLHDRHGTLQACGALGSKSLVIDLSPDERLIAVGTTDGNVMLLDAETLQTRAELRAHTLRTPAVAWSPDGQWLVSGSWDRTLRFWSIKDLDRPAEALIAELEQAWSMGLDEALARF